MVAITLTLTGRSTMFGTRSQQQYADVPFGDLVRDAMRMRRVGVGTCGYERTG